MTAPLPIFIGYDGREDIAFRVCVASIERHSSQQVHIVPLKHKALRAQGLFDRPWSVEEQTGQWIDGRDGKPFSTEFSHTRFLVPALAETLGIRSRWALFCDCDFLFRADVAELFALADPAKAVMCVKHRHDAPERSKMDGQRQTRYRRKNWSSLILWQIGHPALKHLTAEAVNTRAGSWLHGMDWLPSGDLIGSLPLTWNWLAGVSPPVKEPKAVHFTLGGPWFEQYANTPFAGEWIAEMERTKMPWHVPMPQKREAAA